MDKMEIIKVQHYMENVEEEIRNALKYIEFIETSRPLTECEKALKKYCTEMHGIACSSIVMVDMEREKGE